MICYLQIALKDSFDSDPYADFILRKKNALTVCRTEWVHAFAIWKQIQKVWEEKAN